MSSTELQRVAAIDSARACTVDMKDPLKEDER